MDFDCSKCSDDYNDGEGDSALREFRKMVQEKFHLGGDKGNSYVPFKIYNKNGIYIHESDLQFLNQEGKHESIVYVSH